MAKLWYSEQALQWEEAVPLGNSRLGAMVYGGIEYEHIQVNEESIWYGKSMNRNNPDARANLEKIRLLLKEGKISAAEALAGKALTGCPESMHPYQTLGDIYMAFDKERAVLDSDMRLVQFSKAEDYRRELDLDEAVCRVSYSKDNTHYTREYFVSHPADCMVMHFCAEGEKKISFTLKLGRGRFYDGVKKLGDNGVLLYGNLGRGGFEYAMAVKARVNGGTVSTIGEYICVDNAQEAVLCFTADTDYQHSSEEIKAACAGVTSEEDCQLRIQVMLEKRINECLEAALDKGICALREEHIKDYGTLYTRTQLELGTDFEGDCIPTDKRLEKLTGGAEDLGLEKLYFDFGRYLLIACSREGGLPATLQGLWNRDFTPPWDSKYTININTEMNYWPAEITDLGECHMPLLEFLKKLRVNGRKTAREMYGCRGFTAHHNTNIFADTAPQDVWYPGTFWVMGAAWLSTHMWTHYIYTEDRGFLKEAFPVMAESALFFIDFLVERNGYLVTSPSVSPENTYILKSGEKGCLCEGPTMDNQILRELFTDCIEAAAVLGDEADDAVIPDVDNIRDLMKQIENARARLVPTQIDSTGRIMEWMEEYEEEEPGHRHISHLFGLYPSEQITVDKTPELAAAAAKTLECRLKSGGGHTGWSRAWIMNHYAKLWDGEKAHENLKQMLEKSTYPNMFDRHPPFQIDGNFGGCAAMAHMLLQSNSERSVLLPALPSAWKNGHIKGLRIAGNARIDIYWEEGRLTAFTLQALSDRMYVIRYKDRQWELKLKAGEVKKISCEL